MLVTLKLCVTHYRERAANETHTPPGISHPWNFWSATILAAEGRLSFHKEYVVYEVMARGEELHPTRRPDGRFELSLAFDRAAARPLVLLPAALRELKLTTTPRDDRAEVALSVKVVDARQQLLADALPMEISLLDAAGRSVEKIYRALAPGESWRLSLPSVSKSQGWRVRELVSGLTSEQTVEPPLSAPVALTASQVLVPRPADVLQFLTPPAPAPAGKASADFDPLRAVTLPEDEKLSPKTSARVFILLERPQVAASGEALTLLRGLVAKNVYFRAAC